MNINILYLYIVYQYHDTLLSVLLQLDHNFTDINLQTSFYLWCHQEYILLNYAGSKKLKKLCKNNNTGIDTCLIFKLWMQAVCTVQYCNIKMSHVPIILHWIYYVNFKLSFDFKIFDFRISRYNYEWIPDRKQIIVGTI